MPRTRLGFVRPHKHGDRLEAQTAELLHQPERRVLAISPAE
jgi:hypothetical protein